MGVSEFNLYMPPTALRGMAHTAGRFLERRFTRLCGAKRHTFVCPCRTATCMQSYEETRCVPAGDEMCLSLYLFVLGISPFPLTSQQFSLRFRSARGGATSQRAGAKYLKRRLRGPQIGSNTTRTRCLLPLLTKQFPGLDMVDEYEEQWLLYRT